MKSFSILIAIWMFSATQLCAQAELQTKEYFLKKSKAQQNTGWVLLAVGSTATVIGIITGNSQTSSTDYSIPDSSGYLIIGGLLTDIISIPFFVSSSSNARKAVSIGIKNETILPSPNTFKPPVISPVITIRMKI